MWALAGRALAPWAAGAARLLPLCPRHAGVLEPGVACRLFSAAELKVTGSPQEGAGLPHVHRGRAASGSGVGCASPPSVSCLLRAGVGHEQMLLLKPSEKLLLCSIDFLKF